MIEIKSITKSFFSPRGVIKVLDDFSLVINDGAFLGVEGKSGAGKSTLISLIAGLQKPDSGSILYANRDGSVTDIFSLDDKELSLFRNRNIGFVSQEQSFLENLTVFDNVRLPYFLDDSQKKDAAFINERARYLLNELGIAHLEKSWPRELSGGENHRVLIARALINNPDTVIADEPTESVDEERTEQIVRIFKSVAASGKTVILVSHDKSVLAECDECMSL